MKKILIVLDGASDLPVKRFNGKTPLEEAYTPNLDYLTKKAKLGYMYPISEGIIPGSDTSLVSLFGNNPLECKRGIYEAIGAGVKLNKGDLVLRTNFGTIDSLESCNVIDRRAGRTLTTKEAKALAFAINNQVKLKCNFEFVPTIQHRGVLVFRGDFSSNISNVDPEWLAGTENKFVFCRALDSEEKSKESAGLLNDFLKKAHEALKGHPVNIERIKKGLLPANILFTRGAGNKLPKIKQYKNWMSINSMPLEKGIAKLSGMTNFYFDYPDLKHIDVYENLYEGLEKSIIFAIKTIKKQHSNYNGCYIQLKETDLPGHDNKPLDKKKMIEIIDRKFFGFIKKFVEKNHILLVVTSDHSTPCIKKAHSFDPVPILVYNSKGFDATTKFCEVQARTGSLGKIYGRELFEKTGLGK
ncbi:MAG: alkaline phosphatase family protein [Candidatus Nanoarchaeia archaeon]